MGGITFFRRDFLSHSAEKFRGEPFNVSEKLWFRKNLCIKRAYHYSPLNIFCLKVPKNLSLSKNSEIEKFHT